METLYELVLVWYGATKARKHIKDMDASPAHMRHVWDTLWFCKTPHIDGMLRLRFAESVATLQTYVPTNAWDFMGKMLLFDQVPRNIFRNTPTAYNYDSIAHRLAMLSLGLINPQPGEFVYKYEEMPFIAKASVILTLIHSENTADQALAGGLVDQLVQHHAQHANIVKTLREISERHLLRVQLFGRIPERARIKGLPLSPEEETFLSNVS
jgi:uncharacterized protein (DUF924 family)